MKAFDLSDSMQKREKYTMYLFFLLPLRTKFETACIVPKITLTVNLSTRFTTEYRRVSQNDGGGFARGIASSNKQRKETVR